MLDTVLEDGLSDSLAHKGSELVHNSASAKFKEWYYMAVSGKGVKES